MYLNLNLAIGILAFPLFQATIALPVETNEPRSLFKRAAVCEPRNGGLTIADCQRAYRDIPHDDTDNYINPNDLSGLPYIWSRGECTIAGDLINPASAEFVSFLDIASAAREIMWDCVSPLRQGGYDIVGWNSNFKVTIYQFDYEDESDEVGPDPTGKCAIKGSNKVRGDIETCVLNQAAISGYTGP